MGRSTNISQGNTLRLCKYQIFYLLVLAFIDVSWLNSLFLPWMPSSAFQNPTFLLFIIWNSAVIKNFYSYLFIAVQTRGLLVYLVGYNSLLSLILKIKLSQISPVKAPLKLTLVSFLIQLHHSVRISLLPGTRCPRIILYFPCASRGFSHFRIKPWFVFVKSGI